MATLEDVAKKAGCSIATASRALGARGPVSDGVKGRVRKAAAELGYRHGTAGPGRGGRRPLIGVLIPSITNPVFAASLSQIQNRMQVGGHAVVLAQSNYDPAQEADAIEALLSERPTGLILTLCNAEHSVPQADRLPPTVLLNNLPTSIFPAAVTVDNREAGRLITRQLIDHGHRRILFVSGNFAASDRAFLRFEGYQSALAAAGVDSLPALQIPFIGSYEQLDISIAVAEHRPTAIIASNDLLACGVIGALRRQGLSVPQDVSVAGFDGIAMGQLMTPPLTTIEMPDSSMGAVAASLLLDMAERGAAPRHLQVGFTLKPGGTVRSV
ncbi:substrate-binding domain-containing protein [Rhizobium oryzicola]|uniref:Substrate-binding domain-containing protein n=1 Tax=Rhizobium oryzicola TaxID=1232668 RepID=A0ABT8SRZ6_9HYPH|nr:substrate-binding domain-containing protein [Rhizobium oryzicola]MDO1581106.1 substrate-binding domain-containing protein [Rhizobium oryzicola]